MSINESQAKLSEAAKKLFADWLRTKHSWRDENCLQFEKNYIMPLQAELRTVRLAMDQMDTMLSQIRHDCGDQDI